MVQDRQISSVQRVHIKEIQYLASSDSKLPCLERLEAIFDALPFCLTAWASAQVRFHFTGIS